MKTFKRLKTTLTASFENFVNEVENQEAIIDAAILEIKDVLAQTKIQIANAAREQDKIALSKKELQKNANLWRLRAKRSVEKDRDTAKSCINKALNLEADIRDLDHQAEDAINRQGKLQKEKAMIEIKLRDIQSKKAHMLGLQKSNSLNKFDSNFGNACVEDVFKRWEEKLIRDEVSYSKFKDYEYEDQLEKHFIDEELEERLEQELDQLS